MDMNIKTKTAIVTGGALGVGRAISKLLAEEGANITIADIDEKEGQNTARGIVKSGGKAIFIIE